MYKISSQRNSSNAMHPSTTSTDEFLIGAFNSGAYNDLNVVGDLGFNIWHKYTWYVDTILPGRIAPGLSRLDYLTAPIGSYKGEVISTLNDAASHNMKALMLRPKLEWLCAGQRSDYQCEPISKADDNEWFYAFRDHSRGYTTSDSGATVIHCEVNHSLSATGNAGWVVKGLKANTEQSNQGLFKGDSLSTWYIKPRIRIDSVTAVNFPNLEICQVIVLKENGIDTLKKIIIRAGNFYNSQNPYYGQYLEEYYFSGDTNLRIQGKWGNNSWYAARGEMAETDNLVQNHSDVQVYWYGECDMWIDYVRVDDDIADQLFKGAFETPTNNWFSWEANDIASHSAAYRFYIELFEYNNVPCMAYVSRKMDSIVSANYQKHFSLHVISIPAFYSMHVPWADRRYVQNQAHFKKYFLEKTGVHDVMLASYPFNTSYMEPEYYDTSTTWTRIPNTLPHTDSAGTLSAVVAPGTYDTWLQQYLDASPYDYEPASTVTKPSFEKMPGHFRYTMQWGDMLSKTTNIPFIYNAQAHIFKRKKGSDTIDFSAPVRYKGEVQREPTNEELDLTANLAITYGAKGIIYYQYKTDYNTPLGSYEYDRGITNPDSTPRTTNVYGQAKWSKIKSLVQRLKKWEPYIMSFDNANRHSYIYKSEKDSITNNTFINDIKTERSGDVSETYIEDTQANRYVQAAVFNNDSADTYYFMIVNKRCAPYKDESSSDNKGGKRRIKVKFNASHSGDLANFDNWNIIDLETDAVTATFDKNAGAFVNLDWFNPGQGKLYKVVPVMKTGGTFAGNESFSGVSFNFNSPVNTNGKNLTIGGGVKIYFKDTCSLIMNGGNFVCGTYSDDMEAEKSVKLQGQGSGKWRGLCFKNMDTVNIRNSEIKSVDSATAYNDTVGIHMKHSISVLNTKVINMDNCNVHNTTSSAAGILLYYNLNIYASPSVNITRNNIQIKTGNYDGIYIHPYSWLTMTGYIYKNKVINASSGGGRCGIFGFSLEGTPIKNNYIENFKYGVQTWYSSLDLFENTITTSNISNGQSLNGIVSEYNLGNAYESRLGGSNVLTTSNGDCIYLDGLDLNIGDGNNTFKITDSAGYHLRGYFPIPKPNDEKLNGAGNCFRIGTYEIQNEDIKLNVKWSDLEPIIYDFGAQTCPVGPNYCDYYIVAGEFANDTVWYECASGMGGGQKDNAAISPQVNEYNQIYDSLCINMRKKQYNLASQKCMALLNDYSDSARTINAVGKLYLTSLAMNNVSDLKSFFEAFIQSHPGNTKLIQRMFYYIQKAKARLGQYISAMQGFQTIMNQFPTSFEGLAARWDYMATQLLDTTSGQGGGEHLEIDNEQLTEEQQHERLLNLVEDPLDKYDKKKFSKKDRQVIVNNIVTAFEYQKTKEVKNYKDLEAKVLTNEANTDEKKQYKTKSVLKEVVRPQNVKSIAEHISVVQSDTRKVFGSSESKEGKDITPTTVPLEYKLNQNYPNPFNPSTKINYELKNAGFVSLKIYDLLGREIAELVNETKEAGRYTLDFNSSKYMMASGIYFYRIKAGEFVDTKRMVLVK